MDTHKNTNPDDLILDDLESTEPVDPLDALRAEVAELAEKQKALDLAFRSLENRYDALETVLRHMQAAKLGHGQSTNESEVQTQNAKE